MKKIIYVTVFLTSLAWLSSGCSLYQVTSEMTNEDFFPQKTSPAEVLYLEKVERPYVKIGHAIVNTERRNQITPDIIAKLKYEAAILGGDAITNITSNPGTGKWAKAKPQKFLGNANIRVNYVADIIVFQ